MLAGLHLTQIEDCGQLSRLDLELGRLALDGGLELDLLADVDVSLVGRIDDLVTRGYQLGLRVALSRLQLGGQLDVSLGSELVLEPG